MPVPLRVRVLRSPVATRALERADAIGRGLLDVWVAAAPAASSSDGEARCIVHELETVIREALVLPR
jgi:hypothetical protein